MTAPAVRYSVAETGRRGWTADRYQPLHNANGEIAGVITTIEEITERRRAEQALRESEERFRILFDEAPVAYHELDTEGRIVRVNRTELALLGYAREQMLGRCAYEFTLDPEGARSAIAAKLLGTRPEQSFERVFVRKDGTHVAALVTDRFLRSPEGRIVGIRSTLQDITELKALQAELRQAQKLEALGRLAAGIAHDFNNLLSVLLGYSDLLLGDLEPGDTRRSYAEEIKRATESAAAMTRQLLAFGRRQVLKPAVLDLNKVLADMIGLLRRLIGEDIEIALKLEPSLWHVRVDRGQIEQVILNLATNARDAMPNGGTLTVATENVELPAQSHKAVADLGPGRHVHLAVADTGTGMDEDTRRRIFEPFFTTKGENKGTGLGLATVHGIVQQSGGRILVESEPGRGSVFRVYLPALSANAEVGTRRDEAIEEPSRGSQTVLLVEDQPALRKATRELLERNGYVVLEAENGSHAIRLAARRRAAIDLLVSDVVMPGLDGPRLAARLRALHPEMKVLYVSGYAPERLDEETLAKEGSTFLQKPFSNTALLAVVHAILSPAGGRKKESP